MHNIILYDGFCYLCNHSVQFIFKRDPKACFRFASLQSEAGKKILQKYHVSSDLDSIILVEDDQCYFKSSAVLRICKHLKGGWKLGYLLLIVPRTFRDYVYDIVAKNRYKWFGKRDNCMLPSFEIRKRLL